MQPVGWQGRTDGIPEAEDQGLTALVLPLTRVCVTLPYLPEGAGLGPGHLASCHCVLDRWREEHQAAGFAPVPQPPYAGGRTDQGLAHL